MYIYIYIHTVCYYNTDNDKALARNMLRMLASRLKRNTYERQDKTTLAMRRRGITTTVVITISMFISISLSLYIYIYTYIYT